MESNGFKVLTDDSAWWTRDSIPISINWTLANFVGGGLEVSTPQNLNYSYRWAIVAIMRQS